MIENGHAEITDLADEKTYRGSFDAVELSGEVIDVIHLKNADFSKTAPVFNRKGGTLTQQRNYVLFGGCVHGACHQAWSVWFCQH